MHHDHAKIAWGATSRPFTDNMHAAVLLSNLTTMQFSRTDNVPLSMVPLQSAKLPVPNSAYFR